jgi:hypothetical protein
MGQKPSDRQTPVPGAVECGCFIHGCAGLFWSVNQCGAESFRVAHGQAFLVMARKAAALEGKTLPLTQDEATQQMAEDLQGSLAELGPACENAQRLAQIAANHFVNLDMCVRHLRGGGWK